MTMYHIYIYTIYIYVPYMYQSEIFSTSDKQMVFNLCIPLPDEPIETSGNLLSVQFTPLVSRAMVKFHTRKHLIVLAPFWTGASFGSLEENQLKGRTTSPDPPTPRDGPGINGFTKLTPTYSAMNDF